MHLALTAPVNATAQTLTSNVQHAFFGNWIIDTPEHITLLQLNRDLSYLYIKLNHLTPHQSVAEWGRLAIAPNGVRFMASYTNNPHLGLVAYQITHPAHQMTLTKSNTALLLNVDSNADSVTDKQYRYNRNTTHPVYGVWHQLSTPALTSLILLNNGYYATVHINLHQDPHADGHFTHLQWGQFELLAQQLHLAPLFNSHPQRKSALPSIIQSVAYFPNSQQLALWLNKDKRNLANHLLLFKQ
ncbi:hypothetical protein L2703_01040 [Shewanella basaltis]|uniref:hypothetical protein n=1 Tax=Shewanella basaltis TaxID=472183 RepID=UPI00200F3B60|nr:hypothetical protein [Shewanella basaltis]MCL1112201.1 hypothetical protein [Shewanella basaltis]